MRDFSRDRNTDLGVIVVLLNRFNTYRLPHARQLKAKLDRGELLSEYDMRFLKTVFEEGAQARRLAAKHAQYESLVSQAMSYYGELMRRALENEHARSRNARPHNEVQRGVPGP